MEKAVQSLSINRPAINSLLGVGALLLAGCATPAPPLPMDQNPPSLAEFAPDDARLTCAQIGAERVQIHEQMTSDNLFIGQNRLQDKLPERDDVNRLYARQDILIRLGEAKTCPASVDPTQPVVWSSRTMQAAYSNIPD